MAALGVACAGCGSSGPQTPMPQRGSEPTGGGAAGGFGSPGGQEVVCPCHGSTYDANGNVIGGPAPSPLAHHAVSADSSGNLTVHTANVVSPSTRLAV